ncbi:WhiB family transcriptional regulator [Cellulosimicrobium cellulans]|uniref:WhiB family transcriptional regulator n=1 Tax=Cellulosimicrobium cellulans TaxID=1710 RepID=UPI003B8A5A2F|nr:hypothetical protein [Cellulosimicrobium cellulans]
MLTPHDWRTRAVCDDTMTVLFYPPEAIRSEAGRGELEAAAVAVCQPCPVRAACLEYAVANREAHGVWGGTTETERATLLHPVADPTAPTRPRRGPARCGTPSGYARHRRRDEEACDACRTAVAADVRARRARKAG